MDEFDDPLAKPRKKKGDVEDETEAESSDGASEEEDPEDMGLDIEDSFDDDTNF
ncbi:MAG: hypothetical protein WCT19_03880 [Candidatus Paceibacterota bacterium]|jgi:hypothetical protein